jgi:hypothetical protein
MADRRSFKLTAVKLRLAPAGQLARLMQRLDV